VGLVDDLPRQDRPLAFRLHLHPFEGRTVPLAELPANHYPVDRLAAAHVGPLFAIALIVLLRA
jgi:hypothetical protein